LRRPALGWRIFERYLIDAGGLDDFPLATLREELAQAGRHSLALTACPSRARAEPAGRPG
jgi:hypothetical protein